MSSGNIALSQQLNTCRHDSRNGDSNCHRPDDSRPMAQLSVLGASEPQAPSPNNLRTRSSARILIHVCEQTQSLTLGLGGPKYELRKPGAVKRQPAHLGTHATDHFPLSSECPGGGDVCGACSRFLNRVQPRLSCRIASDRLRRL